MEEQDVNNYSSSPHRLPTVSASQALLDIDSASQTPITTGLQRLDRVLQCRTQKRIEQGDGSTGGLLRGQVTEIYGAPGSGKSILGINAAANVLLLGASVVWIDASHVFDGRRLRDLLSASLQAETEGEASCGSNAATTALSERFHHFMTPKLPHLLALLLHPTAAFPSTNVSLLIIDSISSVLTQAFAQSERPSDGRIPGKKGDVAQWAAGRRWAIMADLMSAMEKLAATRNMPVVVISQTTTRLRPDMAASLQPAISGVAWESGISCRILLFRDWQLDPSGKSNPDKRKDIPGLRFAGVIKTGGECLDGFGDVVAFTIDKASHVVIRCIGAI
ncbi:MAG: hypothetical protein Q9202_005545 [Teloschistes flavicans]